MKPKILLFLAYIFIASFAQAGVIETYECLSSETFVQVEHIISEEGGLPPPECPPVLSCAEGYKLGCIKNDIVIPPGEQQQYPPDDAAAWVVDIGCNELSDVSLDDPRWGDREEGEVYARESDNCISLYWPHGGNALFDLSSVVDNPATWNDYLLSGNRPPGGGSYTIGTGKESIRFNDNGSGGMTVFQSTGGEIIPPPVIGGFLKNYTNPKQLKLPAHRVYPMGQKMMLAAWGIETTGTVNDMVANGFTMGGPNWNPAADRVAVWVPAYKAKGLRHAARITNGASMASELYAKMDNGVKEAALFKSAENSLNNILNNPDWNGITDIFLTGSEELSTRMDTAEQKEQGLRYLRKMHEMVQRVDPQKRPLWMSDVTGAQYEKMMVTHKYLDMVGPQNYLDKCCVNSSYKVDAVIGGHAKRVKSTALSLDKAYPQLRPHAATMSHGLLYTPLSQARINNMHKIIPYWVFTAFNEGLQGMQVYSWYSHYTTISAEARNNGKAAYRSAVKSVTKSGADYAYLWGQRRTDVKMEIVSGPTLIEGIKTISMANIQYGNYRYIILTNGAESSVKVKLSGDFSGLRVTEVISGDSGVLGATHSPTIEPLGVRLYKISK